MERLTSNVYEMHAIVKGRVQGVGFRATTRYYALELGLTGSVRNLSDGSVEIYAQGPKQQLEQLMKKLHSEASLGKIQEAVVEYLPLKHYHSDFYIL